METVILSPTPSQLRLAADCLLAGELVAIPTETVYGLAGNAWDPEAVTRIFEAKERPTFDPLIVHIASPWDQPLSDRANPDVKRPELMGPLDPVNPLNPMDATVPVAQTIPIERILHYLEMEQRLVDLSTFTSRHRQVLAEILNRLWPGPLTVVLPKQDHVLDLVTSGLPTIAVRMPAHPVAQSLLRMVSIPLAAPSANRFGQISPTSAADVQAELQGRIAYILDGGPCWVGLESTIIAVQPHGPAGQITVLRPGGISLDQLQAATSIPIEIQTLGSQAEEPDHANPNAQDQTSDRSTAPLAPGMLTRHYAPRKPCLLLPSSISDFTDQHWNTWQTQLSSYQQVGILMFTGDHHSPAEWAEWIGQRLNQHIYVEILSPTGDLAAAAHHLFAKLRSLDASPAEILFAEPCPTRSGLGYAIADRLQRATASFDQLDQLDQL